MIKKDKVLIGFYWGSRMQTIQEAAIWAYNFLKGISANILVFHDLNITGSDRKIDFKDSDDTKAINTLAEEILKDKLPHIKKYYKEIEPSIHFKEPVGSVFSLYTHGSLEEQFIFRFSIGSYSSTLSNVITVDCPKNYMIQYDWAYKLMIFGNKYIKPDYSFISSKAIQKQQQLPEYFFGWMNYFSNKIALPPIPDEYEIEQVDDTGKLLITTREDFDALNNPTHYQKAMQLVDLFRQYDIVRPQ